MKKIIFFCIVLIVKTTSAQDSLNFPKWNFGLGALTTSSIYENFKPNDVIQITPLRLGYGLVFTTKYSINNNFNFDAALEHSGNKFSYRSGKSSSGMNSSTSPKIHLRVNYIFSSSKKTKQTVGVGLVNLFSQYGYGYIGNKLDTVGIAITDITYTGWHPLVQLRYGVLWQTKKQRYHQLTLYANKGFNSITSYTYIRFNTPQKVGSFNFSGTYCGIEYTWFLRKLKN